MRHRQEARTDQRAATEDSGSKEPGAARAEGAKPELSAGAPERNQRDRSGQLSDGLIYGFVAKIVIANPADVPDGWLGHLKPALHFSEVSYGLLKFTHGLAGLYGRASYRTIFRT